MSRPSGPYRNEPVQPYPPRNEPARPYPAPPRGQPGRPYPTPDWRPPPPPLPPRPPAPPRSLRLPGVGLLLSLLGLVVQVLSLTVLPWVYSSAGGQSVAMPELWRAARDAQAHGFAGAYVMLFSYPLALIGIVLSLVAVLESVALKVVWAGLTLLGLGALVVRFGFGPFADLAGGGSLDFSRQEITLALIAVGALVAVIFMLKTAVSMFRRVAGLVLLVLAGVHIAAVADLTDGFSYADLSIGAYGPALGYLLAAIAAIVGPRRILPG